MFRHLNTRGEIAVVNAPGGCTDFVLTKPRARKDFWNLGWRIDHKCVKKWIKSFECVILHSTNCYWFHNHFGSIV